MLTNNGERLLEWLSNFFNNFVVQDSNNKNFFNTYELFKAICAIMWKSHTGVLHKSKNKK